MILHLLLYLARAIFGKNLKPAAKRPTGGQREVTEDGFPLDLDPEVLVPSAGPQILIPNPENADNYGAASSVARAVLRKGYRIFDRDTSKRNLNIVAIRSSSPEFDRFRCRLVHFDKFEGVWDTRSWPITTLPGRHYSVVKLLNRAGVAILAPQQCLGVYRIAKHRNIYEALCQRNGAVEVYRDGNRDRIYDMDPATIQRGEFGINIHATENPDDGISRNFSDFVGSASAGCLVFARVTDFVDARKEWREAKENWGPSFTVTLIEEEDLDDAGTLPKEDASPQYSEKESWHPPGPATTGTRNRNLLNVKQGRDPWKYSTGADSRGHAIFSNFSQGIRAGIITLRTYWKTHKLDSILGIVGRWAPSTGKIGDIHTNSFNDPSAYAAFVAKRVGVRETETLRTFYSDGVVRDADQLFALVSAMVEYENGQHIKIPRHLFDAGLALV